MGSSSKRARRRQKAQESLEREASHSKQVKEKKKKDSDTEEEEDHEVLFHPKTQESVRTPPSPNRVLEVLDCGIVGVTSMVKTLNDAIAAVSRDTAHIQQAYQQLRRDNLARDKAMADLTAMVKEYGSSPAATRPYGPPTPKMQTDVLAVDIGITWADNETFLHGVRVVGTRMPRPTGHKPVKSTPYPEGRNEDRGSSPITGRPSSPETIEFGPETIPIVRPAADRHFRLFFLHGVIFGTENRVLGSGVRLEHGCYYWNRHIGLYITTHTGHKERIAVHRGRSVASTTSEGCRLVRTRLYSGTLLHSTTL